MKRNFLAGLVLALACAAAPALAAEPPLRIAVVNDRTGPFSDYGGEGSVIAARLAVEDFGRTVLGRNIEILSVDHQNKPDVASTQVRQMFDSGGVDAVADGAASSAALAIQSVARERGKIFLITGATTVELTGKECSPTGFHFAPDTYAIANATTKALIASGGKSWFFITADYAFGKSLEEQARAVLAANGGKFVGAVRHPLNSSDMASYLLQAQSSHAEVVGLANAGTDLVNTIKQAQEFGLTGGKQRVTGFLLDIIDAHALGLKAAQGLQFVDPFYWDLNDQTRAWTKRFLQASGGKIPGQIHAGTYTAVLHYLKAVAAAKSTDGPTVARKMKELPINDMYHANTRIREDGRVLNDLHLVTVKSPQESKYPFDYFKLLSVIPGDKSYRPMGEGACPFVAKR